MRNDERQMPQFFIQKWMNTNLAFKSLYQYADSKREEQKRSQLVGSFHAWLRIERGMVG